MPGSRRCLRAALVALLLATPLACATLGFGPAGLLEQARQDMAKNDPDAAYAKVKRIEQEHPSSPESREAFPLAVQCFKQRYSEARYRDPATSVWTTTEAEFMFRWLAAYFAAGYPKQEVDFFFGGMSYDLFRQFEIFSAGDPTIAKWKLEARDDNGFIFEVTATAAGEAAR